MTIMISRAFVPMTRIIFLALTLFVLFGCTKKETPIPEHPGGQIFQGEMRRDVKCHGCHGWLGEGGFGAPALAKSGKTIPANQFIGAVTYGREGMPAYESVLNEKQILLIIDWLEKVSRQSM